MNTLSIIIFMLLVIFAGYHWSGLCYKGVNIPRISLSFLMGVGLVTFVWFSFYVIGIRFSLLSFILSVTTVKIAGFSLIKIFNSGKKDKTIKYNYGVIDKALLLSITILALASILISSYRPVSAWDALTLYDFRAKVIFNTGSINSLRIPAYYMGYPLMTSLAHASIYFLGGSNPQPLYTLIYLSFGGIIYKVLESRHGNRNALITTTLIMFSSELWSHSTFAYTNLAYTVYFVSSLLLLLANGAESSNKNQIFISSILLGLSVWVRSAEPFWIVWIALYFFAFSKHHHRKLHIFYLLPFFLIKYSWQKFQTFSYQSIGVEELNIFYLLRKTDSWLKIYSNSRELIAYIYANLVSSFSYYWFIIAAWIMLIASKSIKNNLFTKLIGFALLSIFLITTVGIVITSIYLPSWKGIGDSVVRMMMFVSPLSVILWSELYMLNQKKYK